MGVGMEHDHWIPASEWPQLIERVRMAQAAFHFQGLIGATDCRVG